MVSPLLHSHATGIHPGAHVGATAPSTTGVQDHILWIDTSGGLPYALKMWDVASGTWRAIGSALPPGTTGDLLVNVNGTWRLLAPGSQGQKLVIADLGGLPFPVYADDCCATVAKTIDPTPATDPTPGTAGDQERCGAAATMALYLEQYYANTRTVLNVAGVLTTAIALPALADLLLGAAPSYLAMGGLLSARQLLRLLVRLVTGGLHITVAPVLTDPQKAAIQQAIYCALPMAPAPLEITALVRSNWEMALSSAAGFGAGQTDILNLLANIVSLAGWQAVANMGVLNPSDTCAACHAAHALTGGAGLSLPPGGALTGGAGLGLPAGNSLTGGAQLLPAAHALTGGAGG